MNARLAKPEEAAMAVEWLAGTPENLFDPDVVGYQSSVTLAVENKSGPLLFMPLQVTVSLTMDAIGKKPGIRKREMAFALVELIEATRRFAQGARIAEIYFLCVEQGIVEQAEKFGFERIMFDEKKGMALFRMKVISCEDTSIT